MKKSHANKTSVLPRLLALLAMLAAALVVVVPTASANEKPAKVKGCIPTDGLPAGENALLSERGR